MRRLAPAAVLGVLLATGCRSYSPESIQAIYRDDLGWEGRDDPAVLRKPSEDHWKRV